MIVILPFILRNNYMDRTKYNVDKDREQRTCNGIVFDSILEMRYFRDVILPLKESGKIVNYELQKKFILQPEFRHDNKHVQSITYVADFYIEYDDGRVEVIDTKGCPDSVAKIKRKMFWYVFPDKTYRWICYSKIDGNDENKGWCDYEYVQRQRKLRKKNKQKDNGEKKE